MSPIIPFTPAAPTPLRLVQILRQDGLLAKLFHQAAHEQRAAIKAILRGRGAERLIGALRNDAAARVEAKTAQSPLQVLHQCAPGCNACCRTVAVDVTPLEALAIADYLRANYEESRLEAVAQRLRSNAEARRRMTAEQLRQVRLNCAFLDDEGKCGVYQARPLACAGAFSMSRKACEIAAESAANTQAIPFDPHAKTWTMGVSGGLQRALVEAGVDGNLYELSSIVLRALEVPNAARLWLRREDVFRPCICTDPHSPPRAQMPSRRKAA
ncbi:MAG: YkgJ family cysteine cluster protein [Planctomycetes bacterium]|nr:YkgJ family cysteine cluster protein [Planctomycetota bacterium]